MKKATKSLVMSRPGFAVTTLAAMLALAVACSRQSLSPTAPGAQGSSNGDAGPDGATLKSTAPGPTDPINDKQLTDTSPTLTASPATLLFGTGTLSYRFQVFNDAGAQLQDSGIVPTPSFRVTATMEFKKRHTWRVRAEYQGAFGPWSAIASFISSEGGYIRGNEVFDPLTNNTTVGKIVGPVTFLGAQGVRLDTVSSYIGYLLPQTITPSGEFSMEIEGLRANAPGDKSKVFGIMEGLDTDNYITNRYRVDVQYRGTSGFPANSITFRALYGDGDDLSKRYEPTTDQRFASVFNLNPSTTYYWRAAWGSTFRVTVREGGINGRIIYDISRNSFNATYNPQPMYAFIGTPIGRSGAESATIPGTIYRNVWISARARP